MKSLVFIISSLILISCNKKENNVMETTVESKEKLVLKDALENDTASNKILKLTKKYNFNDYKVVVYKGKLHEPNFENNPFANDKEYVKFIKNGCRENGINFCGHYTIILKGCGAECSHTFIVDRINGKIFIDIKPNDGRYGYEFRKNSSLLIANSSLFIDDKFEKYFDYWCKPEFYKWENKKLKLLNPQLITHN